MEFAPGGELFARLTEEGPYGEQEAKGIFAQIASAVEYMVSEREGGVVVLVTDMV